MIQFVLCQYNTLLFAKYVLPNYEATRTPSSSTSSGRFLEDLCLAIIGRKVEVWKGGKSNAKLKTEWKCRHAFTIKISIVRTEDLV